MTGASVPGVGGSNGIGILEPSTLQATAEPELPSRGAVSLFIMAQNLNLSMLSAKSDLAASFRATIQGDIARELGPGFTPEHVDVRLLAESAAIPVTITAPSGVSCHDLHRWLCNKPLRWAGHKSTKLSMLEGFSAVCLSPSWCLSTIGMPSIVDEASTTVSGGSPLALQVSLAQDLPAVPDEQDLVLPRCLQRTGHTPRDPGKPPRASPKRRSMAKVGRLTPSDPQSVTFCYQNSVCQVLISEAPPTSSAKAMIFREFPWGVPLLNSEVDGLNVLGDQ